MTWLPTQDDAEEFFNASYIIYYRSVPSGLNLLTTPDGIPLVSAIDVDGFYAAAFTDQDKIIIAYEGTSNNNESYGAGTAAADIAIAIGQIPAAFNDAQDFYTLVSAFYPAAPIFVTGHSLGGAEAEFVGSNNPNIAGGITFGAPGLPSYVAPSGVENVSTFYNYVDFGDPIGNYAADAFSSEAGLAFTGAHYGSVLLTGLSDDAGLGPYYLAQYLVGNLFDAGAQLSIHLLPHYALDLGISGPHQPVSHTTFSVTTIVDPITIGQYYGSTTAQAVNNSGQVAGYFYPGSGGFQQGFIDDHTNFTTITLPFSTESVYVFGINNTGTVVGQYNSFDGRAHGFTYGNGAYTYIDDPLSDAHTEARAINDAGDVVGVYTAGGFWHGFLFRQGSYTTIDDPLAGDGYSITNSTYLEGINDFGQIVGTYYDAHGVSHGFLYSGGAFTNLDGPVRGDGAFHGSAAFGINNLGQIVGEYQDESGSEHSFLYGDGNFHAIDLPRPHSINDGDVIVGDSFVAAPAISYAASQTDFSALGTSTGGNEGTMISLGSGFTGVAGPVTAYIHADGNTNVVFALYATSSPQATYNGFYSLVQQIDVQVNGSYDGVVSGTFAAALNPDTYYYLAIATLGFNGNLYGEAINTTPYELITNAITDETSLAPFGMPYFTLQVENQQSDVPCFLRGTMILTDNGEVPVEELRVGQEVTTLCGAAKAITWIGHGRRLVTAAPQNARPVIVRCGALSEGVPSRDFRLTRSHSLCLDEMLVPVEYLINGHSILWDEAAREVEFYHIELVGHDVVFADGAPAETYREDGNRTLFDNPDAPLFTTAETPWFAPVVTEGPKLDALWRKLLKRSGFSPPELCDDPDLHLLLDGVRVDAIAVDEGAHPFQGRYRFPVAQVPACELRIVSRQIVPALSGIHRDPRQLGVAVRSITLRDANSTVELWYDSGWLREGFHDPEDGGGFRWMTGAALLPSRSLALFDGPFELALDVVCTSRYPPSKRVARLSRRAA